MDYLRRRVHGSRETEHALWRHCRAGPEVTAAKVAKRWIEETQGLSKPEIGRGGVVQEDENPDCIAVVALVVAVAYTARLSCSE